MPPRGCRTSTSPPGWTAHPTASLGDDNASAASVWRVLRIKRGRVDRVVFPPQEVAEVKAIACELPRSHDLPLSRFSRVELHRLVLQRGVTDASASTIWRWLHEDAIKPWQVRSWIFPRDPNFAERAGRALDLYARSFEGRRLRPNEYVICADEKTQLQALGRHHDTVPPGPGRPGLVEFDYLRGAAPWPTWPPGTPTTPTCLTASSRPPGSSPSPGLSTRSCRSSPTARRAPCSGSSTPIKP
jgi:hypothetical protein